MAWSLLQAGADLILVGRNKKALLETVSDLKQKKPANSGRVESIQADLLDRSILKNLVAEATTFLVLRIF